jgi:hypothetical protein
MKIYIRALHLWNMDPPGAKSPIRAPARGACLILTGSGYSFPGRQLGAGHLDEDSKLYFYFASHSANFKVQTLKSS